METPKVVIDCFSSVSLPIGATECHGAQMPSSHIFWFVCSQVNLQNRLNPLQGCELDWVSFGYFCFVYGDCFLQIEVGGGAYKP